MYLFNSGILALNEQIRKKNLPEITTPVPERQAIATARRQETDAALINRAQKNTRAVRMLQSETARKKKEMLYFKLEQIEEIQKARKRNILLRQLTMNL